MKLWVLSSLATLTAVSVALAHTGSQHPGGFGYGFGHPLGGLDHLLAMLAVGLWAAQVGGRATWAVPLCFVTLMAVGGGLGMAGATIPMVEAGILASVLVLGLLIAFSAKLPLWFSTVLVGVFAVFHGLAHGAEMPVSVSGLEYALGFILATALLHLAGIVMAWGGAQVARLPTLNKFQLWRLVGGAIFFGGAYLGLVG